MKNEGEKFGSAFEGSRSSTGAVRFKMSQLVGANDVDLTPAVISSSSSSGLHCSYFRSVLYQRTAECGGQVASIGPYVTSNLVSPSGPVLTVMKPGRSQ
jgi:hypothetical protein